MRRFFLNTTEVEEPIGYESIVINLIRDPRWHGINSEASSSTLTFIGEDARILRTAKENYGVDAVVTFKAEVKCDGESEYQTEYEGSVTFASYEQTCGDDCRVSITVEQNSCAMVFKNRFEQKIDLSDNKAFDKITNLTQYTGLDRVIELPAQDIPIANDAQVAITGDTVLVENQNFFRNIFGDYIRRDLLIRPTYSRVNDNSILTGQLDDPFNIFQDTDKFFLLSPQVLLEEPPSCVDSNYVYNTRLKGSFTFDRTFGDEHRLDLYTCLRKWDGNGDIIEDGEIIGQDQVHTFMVEGGVYNFDEIYSGTTTLNEGESLYAFILIRAEFGGTETMSINSTTTFEEETSFLLSNIRRCPPTDANVNLVNETLARLTESITDRCLTVKSDYYGRTDSQPYSHTEDGCGALRVITNGLKIRQAEEKKFFISMRDLMDGLRAIDNIGHGLFEGDVRIEPAEWFYQDVKILDLPLVPQVKSSFDEGLIYTSIKGGYEKWEIKSIKGIDEFNSQKEYRTSIKSVSNDLDIRSKLIASGYIIESLRTQTLLNSGSTDSTYDNDAFVICVKRYAGDYIVERNITENAANFFSPTTAYNWRIRPIYNLMRWFKSIAQSYVNLNNTESKIFFSSGTGNYEAEGNISVYDDCSLESRVIAENSDISIQDFKVTPTPIFKPDIASIKYPITSAQYELIKANPYGYINVQCGRGDYKKYYIKTIKYKPVGGMTDFELIEKWH